MFFFAYVLSIMLSVHPTHVGSPIFSIMDAGGGPMATQVTTSDAGGGPMATPTTADAGGGPMIAADAGGGPM